MTKLIAIVLVTVLLVFWFRHMANKRIGRDSQPKQDKTPEDMVRCRVCGVNLPRSEAILSRGRFYCCDEHRRSDA